MSTLDQTGSPEPAPRAAKPRWFRSPEALAAIGVFLLLLVMITGVKVRDTTAFHGDTALFFQLTQSIADTGKPDSNAFTNILAFTKARLVKATAQQIEADPLEAPHNDEGDVLTWHAYYIMYPIALLAKIFPIPPLLMTLYALSFVGMLGLAYYALRRKQLPILAAILFCLIVISHPAWVDSLMLGQFYPDRLFVLLGFGYMYLASRDDTPRAVLVGAAILAALVIERAALTAGLFTVAYVVLYWKRPNLDRYFKLGLGLALTMYGVFLLRFVLIDTAYSSFLPRSFGQMIALFQIPGFAEKTALFLLINGLLLVIAIFEWRAAAIAAFLMLPNIFGNIGGAEKIGWVTHYHSFYFPALVWAAVAGYVVLYRKLASVRRTPAFYAGGLAVAIALSAIDPFKYAPPNVSLKNVANNFVFLFPSMAIRYLGAEGARDIELGSAIDRVVPLGAVVTTPESAMPFLYDHRDMHFFPLGVDTSDYAVLGYAANAGAPPTYSGIFTFLGPQEAERINKALVARMKRDGYDFEHPVIFPGFGMAIVQRSHHHSRIWRAASDNELGGLAGLASLSASAQAARRYPKPAVRATIAQVGKTVAARGVATATDLTGTLAKRPVIGDTLIAFASTGFGCQVARGWSLLGDASGAGVAAAYYEEKAGDGATFVPFTTPRANGYSLILIDVHGGPGILHASSVDPGTVGTPSLAIPQIGGALLDLDATMNPSGKNRRPVYPHGQTSKLLAITPRRGNVAQLVVRSTVTDPRDAKQPFVIAPPHSHGAVTTHTPHMQWLIWIEGQH